MDRKKHTKELLESTGWDGTSFGQFCHIVVDWFTLAIVLAQFGEDLLRLIAQSIVDLCERVLFHYIRHIL